MMIEGKMLLASISDLEFGRYNLSVPQVVSLFTLSLRSYHYHQQ